MLDHHNPSKIDRELVFIEDIFEAMDEGDISSDSKISPYVHTPKELCQKKLDKTVENNGNLSGNILVLNPEYVFLLLSDRYNTSKSTIYFYTDDVYMKQVVEGILTEHSDADNVKIIVDDTPVDDILGCFFESNNQDTLTNRDVKMQFDVVAGNPPYERDYGATTSDSVWNEFVDKSLDMLKNDGWLSLVHPSGWRNVDGNFKDVQKKLLTYNLKYLNLNDVNDGLDVFGATTPFDWYVLQKNKNKSSMTTISTTEGDIVERDISEAEFIPNAKFEKIFSLLAGKDDENVEILHSWSDYESRKDHMSKEKRGDYIHPCVRYVYQDERGIDCYYSNTREYGHFGTPKVMVGRMADTGRITVDENGEYGLTEYMFGIVDEPEVLPKIKRALDSNEFHQIMDLCRFNRIMFNRKIISLFRKDFWKEFV